ncbi:hypothetical protein AX17_004112 [Amanita inopinata Kibby_2008]|nr:hypothetical protein AX17_004112 [Amanita inopinata Kibby_2008]
MDHGDHGGHDMPMCSMNMLWNTDIINTCIVFRSWHISSTPSFIFSFIIIVLIGVFYEYLRLLQRRVDIYIAQAISRKAKGRGRGGLRSPASPPSRGSGSPGSSPGLVDEERDLLTGRKVGRICIAGTPVPLVYRIIRATLYGLTVFLSFFIMLIFMTYNAYLILAVVLGAVIGHFEFGGKMNVDAVLNDCSNGKGMACH